jgi:1-acyl-sn-glycerol-3-phosphate acyltransferase
LHRQRRQIEIGVTLAGGVEAMSSSHVARMSVPQRSWLWRTLQGAARIWTTLMFDVKVYGRRNVPRRGGVLLLSNHQSYLDPVVLGVHLDRPISYMAKSELFEGGGFFAWLIRSLHAFPVKQGRGDVGAIKESINRLHQGHVLNIYPEGSRTETGEIEPILPGVALVVRRAGVPIVPVVIDGSFQAWPKMNKLFRPGRIRVMYGPPMHVNGLKPDELVKLIDRTLRAMLSELRERRRKGGAAWEPGRRSRS